MTLMNDSVLGIIGSINLTAICERSNETWGMDDPSSVEGQLAFALLTHLGGMHIDLHCPDSMLEGEVQLLERHGLPKFVKSAGTLYDWCVRNSFNFAVSEMGYLISKVRDKENSYHFSREVIDCLPSDPCWRDYVTAFGSWGAPNQLKAWALRYLKRFTVDNALKLETECLRAFIATDHRNKMLDGRCFSNNNLYQKILPRAKKYLDWLLDDFDVNNVFDFVDGMDFQPTTNAVANCCKDPRHRILRVMAAFYNGIPASKEENSLYPYLHGYVNLTRRGEVTISAVPKDVKSYRIVSPDDPINLVVQSNFVKEVERCIKSRGMEKNLPFRDQEIMRKLCYDSVLEGVQYSTLDLSRASDTVRLLLVRQLLCDVDGGNLLFVFDEYRPKRFFSSVLKTGESKTLYMASPMGSGWTLLLQSLVFWAIDCAACELYVTYFNHTSYDGEIIDLGPLHVGCDNPLTDEQANDLSIQVEKLLDSGWTIEEALCSLSSVYGNLDFITPHCCYAMGDDQQVPTPCAVFCIEVLERFGFIVNESKSFFDEEANFRESCGAEAIAGDDPVIDGFYITRHSLNITLKKDVDRSAVPGFNGLTLNRDEFWNERDKAGEAFPSNTITSVIRIAKTFLLLGLPKIGMQVQKWIAREIPSMTVSKLGTPADDLWGSTEIVHKYHSQPIAHFTTHYKMVRSKWFPSVLHQEPFLVMETSKSDEATHMVPMHWAITSKRKKLDGLIGVKGVHKFGSCDVCRWLAYSEVNRDIATAFLEDWKLNNWLRIGPTYEDELSRLLRVSSPTPQIDVISTVKEGQVF